MDKQVEKDIQIEKDIQVNKKFVENLVYLFPYYFDPVYDDPKKREEFRDGFIRYAVERVLYTAEIKCALGMDEEINNKEG